MTEKTKHVFKLGALLGFALWVAASGCRKKLDFEYRDALLEFSSDTVFLDTVFTTIGSSTRRLTVYNRTNENLLINKVSLGKGPGSYYRINVNGTATRAVNDVEILANDSIYIFIEVTTDVKGANEMLFTDSIVFQTGKNRQDVKLVTLARDAHFIYPNNQLVIERQAPLPPIIIPYSILPCNATWATDKPYVVYGYAVVDSGCVLNVTAGAQIHFHSGSGLWVLHQGSLQVDAAGSGNFDNPAVFQGDRLEPWYKEVPGQWGGLLGGIYLMGSSQNSIQNAVIKNATTAIRVDSTTSMQPNLELKNVRLFNHSRVALQGGFAHIRAENVAIANCGLYGFYALGGRYEFRHSTFANYWGGNPRSTPTIALFNFFEDDNQNIRIREIAQAYFGNCIVYGNNQNEFGLGYSQNGQLNFNFNHGLLRIERDPDDGSFDRNDPAQFTNCLFNQPPRFEDTERNVYDLDSISPAIGAGNQPDANQVPRDIRGVMRDINNPTLGAFEKQP